MVERFLARGDRTREHQGQWPPGALHGNGEHAPFAVTARNRVELEELLTGAGRAKAAGAHERLQPGRRRADDSPTRVKELPSVPPRRVLIDEGRAVVSPGLPPRPPGAEGSGRRSTSTTAELSVDDEAHRREHERQHERERQRQPQSERDPRHASVSPLRR